MRLAISGCFSVYAYVRLCVCFMCIGIFIGKYYITNVKFAKLCKHHLINKFCTQKLTFDFFSLINGSIHICLPAENRPENVKKKYNVEYILTTAN